MRKRCAAAYAFTQFSLFCTGLLLCVALASAHAATPAVQPSLETMIGQMVMVGFRGTGEDLHKDDLPVLLRDIAAGRVGGVILFDFDWETKQPERNVRSSSQILTLTHALQEKAAIPLFIAVDQEGGEVRRLQADMGVPETPSALQLASEGPEGTHAAALSIGSALKKLGINVNLAPVADVALNPLGPAIGKRERAFSSHPAEAARLAKVFAEGLSQGGVVPAYKHFPGHGSATSDTHLVLPDISNEWKPEELLPYATEQRPNVPMMMMVGHLFNRTLDAELPSSLSPAVINGVLRGQLGWDGVVITDDIQMSALTLHYSLREIILYSVQAGVDIVLASNNIEHSADLASVIFNHLVSLVQEGKITQERIALSYARIMKLKSQANILH